MKKFYQENRIFIIMMAVVLICLVIIVSLLLIYFYKGNNKSNYGNRLDDIKEVPITDKKISELENKIKEIAKVEDCRVRLSGRILYISITFEAGADLITSEGKAATLLNEFSDEEKKLYDFQFTIKENKEDGFILSGAKSKNNATLVWNNNNN